VSRRLIYYIIPIEIYLHNILSGSTTPYSTITIAVKKINSAVVFFLFKEFIIIMWSISLFFHIIHLDFLWKFISINYTICLEILANLTKSNIIIKTLFIWRPA